MGLGLWETRGGQWGPCGETPGSEPPRGQGKHRPQTGDPHLRPSSHGYAGTKRKFRSPNSPSSVLRLPWFWCHSNCRGHSGPSPGGPAPTRPRALSGHSPRHAAPAATPGHRRTQAGGHPPWAPVPSSLFAEVLPQQEMRKYGPRETDREDGPTGPRATDTVAGREGRPRLHRHRMRHSLAHGPPGWGHQDRGGASGPRSEFRVEDDTGQAIGGLSPEAERGLWPLHAARSAANSAGHSRLAAVPGRGPHT